MSENTAEIAILALMAQAIVRTNPAATLSEALQVASDMLDGFKGLAHLFKMWSEHPESECPNYLVVRCGVVEDEKDAGQVEIILRRVRPGGTPAEALFDPLQDPV